MQEDGDASVDDKAAKIDNQRKTTHFRDMLIFSLLYLSFRWGIDNFAGRRAAAPIERVSPRPELQGGQLQTAAQNEVEGSGNF